MHQGSSECFRPGRIRTAWAGRDLLLHFRLGPDQARHERSGRLDRLHLGPQPGELCPFHDQAQPQRVPPADVGAAIRIVADPAGQRYRPRHDLRPFVRPDGPRLREQRAGEAIQGITPVRNGQLGRGEFIGKRNLAGAVTDETRVGRPTAGGFRQRGENLRRMTKCRVRREHRGKPRALHLGAEFGQFDRAVVGVRPDQSRGERAPGHLRAATGTEAHIGRQPTCPAGERGVPQVADQRRDLRFGQLALVHLAADRKRHREHGIAERVLRGAGAGALHLAQQISRGRVVGLGVVRHGGRLAPGVPGGSKRARGLRHTREDTDYWTKSMS